ncbi:hypothetical protein [Desulfofalx alkaliphila]|uniref:hypothetical protein n=1 Tax=Desulfofalx alkaliphila TaxID=105483 RepID=UPI0004E113F4|nr:hypothetical protein [Desulfofalx alkaliphila]
MNKNQAKLNETLERLLDRIESYHAEKHHDVHQSSLVFDRLDKLVQSMSRIESQQSSERILSEKIDEVTKHIDKIMTQQAKQEKQLEFEDTIRKVLHGAKITGKVIETVASSADVMFNTISHLVKDDGKGKKQKANTEELDLANLLKPINSLIQGFAAVGSTSKGNYDSTETETEEKEENKAE